MIFLKLNSDPWWLYSISIVCNEVML